MALATRCPHCQTTFRVANDQLKLRAGLVRCGSCKQIFNGVEHLLPIEGVPPPRTTAPPRPPGETALRPATPVVDAGAIEPHGPPLPAGQPEPSGNDGLSPAAAAAAPVDDNAGHDPLLRMTLMDFAHAQHQPRSEEEPTQTPPPAVSAPDPLEQAMEVLQAKPLRDTRQDAASDDQDELDVATMADYEEPSFVRQGRRRQRFGRTLRIAMVAGSCVLLILLLAQSAYLFRDRIAARFPEAKPALAFGCALLECRVGLPAQPEEVSIESSDLESLTPDKKIFSLTALLRNRSATAQAWPNIELTLNDANDKALARRVFTPRDYLPPGQNPDTGFAPASERSIKLFFELTQLKASGYRMYLFYP
jgi:predicted Zn finger-like uncharacterized protein